MVEITMQGPAKNALGTDMFNFLLERLAEANGEPVLLTGAGDAFCAGLNLKEVASLDAAGMETYLRLLERCMAAYYLYPAPVVALVNGHAIAGGSILALCADHGVVVNDPRVRVGLNEVALGVRFPPRVLHIARNRLPRTAHEAVLLGAGLFAPEQAVAYGLVDEVSADAPKAARARLEQLAAHPRDAYAATKRALRGATPAEMASDDALDAWMRECAPIWAGDAVKQRVLAVLKR
jgi:enoyl-CoA hydratase/carnithine racemase